MIQVGIMEIEWCAVVAGVILGAVFFCGDDGKGIRRVQWNRFGMSGNVLLRVFCLLGAHSLDDVRGASR